MGKQSCGVCSKDLLFGFCVPSRKPVPGPMKFAVNQRRSMSLPSFKSKFQISTDSIQFFSLFSKNIALPRVILWDFDLATRKAPCLRWQLVKCRVTFVALGIEDRRTQVWRKLDFLGVRLGIQWVLQSYPTHGLPWSKLYPMAGLQFSFVRMPHALIRVLAFWI